MFNRVAFVTGASRGIGRAIALTLCRANFDIVVASPEIERNEQVAEEIRACSGEAMTLNLDVTSPESVKEAFAKTLKDKTRIDVLVNNAGITRDGLAMRMKPADWDLVLNINLTGAFRCIQQVLPTMMRSRWGRIVNIASVVGQAGAAGQANYAASKGGMIAMTKALAQEIGSRGVTVNAVAPGYIETDMTRVLPEGSEGQNPRHCPPGPHRPTRGHRQRRQVSGQRRGRLHHRPHPRRQRRHVYVECMWHKAPPCASERSSENSGAARFTARTPSHYSPVRSAPPNSRTRASPARPQTPRRHSRQRRGSPSSRKRRC